ncbi:MAG TPA: tetratricopeptide repeat protein [Parasulfuritortus sp.]
MGTYFSRMSALTFDSSVFNASLPQSGQMDSYAQSTLVKALQLYSDGKYSKAISVFQQAIGYSPTSTAAINAYDYMAKSYQQLGETNKAIETYKKSIVADPSLDTTHSSLANIYYSQGDYSSAVKQYEKAAKLNDSSANLYSLGQGYMADGQYNNAIKTFEQVRRLAPTQPYGDFGMGQVYAKQGQYQDAITSFQKAIKIAPQYWNAYSEMGYALADSGQLDKAKDVVTTLNNNNSTSLASQLNVYIYGKTKPQMTSYSYGEIGTPFLTGLGPGTQVSSLGNLNLAIADASQTFSVDFQFSKPMDAASVQDVLNWTIMRSSGTFASQNYNYGQPLSSTETLLPYRPTAVVYNKDTLTATVLFTVTQNSAADATIDPSHIQFTFNGKDATGLAMDTKANEYTGYSGFA